LNDLNGENNHHQQQYTPNSSTSSGGPTGAENPVDLSNSRPLVVGDQRGANGGLLHESSKSNQWFKYPLHLASWHMCCLSAWYWLDVVFFEKKLKKFENLFFKIFFGKSSVKNFKKLKN
jgi:hypothetical protein